MEIQSRYQIPCWLWVSEPFDEFSNLQSVYQRIQALLVYQFYRKTGSTIRESEFSRQAENLELPFKFFNECIDKQDLRDIYAHFHQDVSAKIAQKEYYPPSMLKKGWIETGYYTIHKMDENGFDVSELHSAKMNCFNRIEQSTSCEDGLNELKYTLELFQEFMRKNRRGHTHMTIKAILEHIHEHFAEGISLQSVARQFHLNKNYLSQLFKQQTGENFNLYLTKLRIHKAKELLRHSEQNINSVCQATGFDNPSYFGQVFKKYVGMTPSEYSKLYK